MGVGQIYWGRGSWAASYCRPGHRPGAPREVARPTAIAFQETVANKLSYALLLINHC